LNAIACVYTRLGGHHEFSQHPESIFNHGIGIRVARQRGRPAEVSKRPDRRIVDTGTGGRHNADGNKNNPWGANPKGAYIFSPDGRFAQMLFHTDLPKIDNRMGGTPDQNKAIAQGVIAMYGSYTVDEANKTINVKFEGSSFAKFVGTEGKRVITSINDNEFQSTNPATSTGTKAESVWRRM